MSTILKTFLQNIVKSFFISKLFFKRNIGRDNNLRKDTKPESVHGK